MVKITKNTFSNGWIVDTAYWFETYKEAKEFAKKLEAYNNAE